MLKGILKVKGGFDVLEHMNIFNRMMKTSHCCF